MGANAVTMDLTGSLRGSEVSCVMGDPLVWAPGGFSRLLR